MGDYAQATGVDWPKVIDELERTDARSLTQLARRSEVPRQTLNRYRGEVQAEPAHRTGERIIAAWLKATRRTRDELPMRVVIVRGRK